MGCDIHSYAEVLNSSTGKWEVVGDVFPLSEFDREWSGKDFGPHPFDWRSYSMFGFLAGVRNYSYCEPLVMPRGLPDDASEEILAEAHDWGIDGHSHSWLMLRELVGFDYNRIFWNRRVTKEIKPGLISGASSADEGEGEHITYRQHLGTWFFKHLDALGSLGKLDAVRIVFWFDN